MTDPLTPPRILQICAHQLLKVRDDRFTTKQTIAREALDEAAAILQDAAHQLESN